MLDNSDSTLPNLTEATQDGTFGAIGGHRGLLGQCRRDGADVGGACHIGDGALALLMAVTRLLKAPVRATTRAFTLLEARGRAAGQRLHEARLMDVSVGGVKVRTTQPLRMGELVSLGFTLTAREPMILAGGRIVRQAGEEPGAHAYGVEFNDLHTHDRDLIARFVERALLKQGKVADGGASGVAARVAERELAAV